MTNTCEDYEVEADEMSRANPPVELTPELWLIKLLLGAIDPSYDTQDEKSAAQPAQGGYPGQGGYGAPLPQQNYGQGQGGYNQPPPGQYGQQQQPGGYGRPPPNQPYPPQQQGGYGAPPGPPRY